MQDLGGAGPDYDASAFANAYSDELAKVGRFNLAVFGKTGVGKSTLINAMFGRAVAQTGVGRPVTRDSHLYVHESGTLGVYDTRGVEIGVDGDLVIAQMQDLVTTSRGKALTEQIHVAWYCVRSSDARFEDAEARFVRALNQLGLPTLLVLTQVGRRGQEHNPEAVALAASIEELGLPILGRAHLTNALADPWLDYGVHGLEPLLDDTFTAVPEGVEAALNSAQQVDFRRKRRAANTRIMTAVALATTAGATPIPFSDAAMLVPIQTAMMGSISVTYGVPMDASLVAGLAATGLATQAGRTVTTGLLKMIPGAGSVAGGTISAAVAAAFTYGMGMAWREVCERMAHGEFGDPNDLDRKAIKRIFLQEFRKQATSRLGRRSKDGP